MKSKIKVLNLYAGIGGNRKLWENVEVVAVEWDKKIARIYQDFFPNDKVVVCDAHQYLLEHFDEFDFIWSSPPCPTHSIIRKCYVGKNNDGQNKPVFPDMKLYEEILFCMGYVKSKWCIENVKSWYNPLIKPYEVGGHYFWSNFFIPNKIFEGRNHYGTVDILEKRKKFDLSSYSCDKITTLRNCVEPELGSHIFDCAFKYRQEKIYLEVSEREK